MKKYIGFILVGAFLFYGIVFFAPKTYAGCDYIPWSDMKLTAATGRNKGEVLLRWRPVFFANHYFLLYGLKKGKYIYGASDIGFQNANSYTVKLLKSKTRYYFQVSAGKECSQGSVFSKEASAVAR